MAPALTAGTFELIVLEHRRELLGYARRLTAEDAEDVLQASLERAWRALERGEIILEPRRWLYLIVRRQVLNTWAARRTRPSVAVDLEFTADYRVDVELEVERRDEVRRALQAVAELPPRQRAALELTLAGRDDTQPGADRQRLWRARQAVRASVRPTPTISQA